MTRREISFGLAAAAMMFAAGCVPGAPSSSIGVQPTAAALRSITIQVPNKGANLTWLYVTQDLGLFRRHGLQPTIVSMTPNTAAAALQSGEINVMTATGSAARAALQGLPVRIVLIAADRATYVLVGAKGLSTVDQLRGKVVAAYSPQNSINSTTVELLRRKGLSPGDYTLLNAGDDTARTAAVVSGQASATLLDVSAALRYLKDGYPALARGADIPPLPASGLAVSMSTLNNDRELVRNVVQAALEGLVTAAGQKEATVATMAQEFELDPDDAAEIYDEMAPTWTRNGQPSAAALGLELESDQRDLQLSTPINPDQIYDFGIVRELTQPK